MGSLPIKQIGFGAAPYRAGKRRVRSDGFLSVFFVGSSKYNGIMWVPFHSSVHSVSQLCHWKSDIVFRVWPAKARNGIAEAMPFTESIAYSVWWKPLLRQPSCIFIPSEPEPVEHSSGSKPHSALPYKPRAPYCSVPTAHTQIKCCIDD